MVRFVEQPFTLSMRDACLILVDTVEERQTYDLAVVLGVDRPDNIDAHLVTLGFSNT